MQQPPAVYVLSVEDYRRIEMMLARLTSAMDTLFDRRLIEPMTCPDDTGDFDSIAEKVQRDYLF